MGDQGVDGMTGMTGNTGPPGNNTFGDGGVVFVHWGSRICPCGNELSAGFAASPYFGETGGGTNYLCLPTSPTFDVTNNLLSISEVVGVKFATAGEPLASSDGLALGCSYCLADQSVQLMIPGSAVCPAGWMQAYRGYLMSAKDQASRSLTPGRNAEHFRTEYICVNENPADLSPMTTPNGDTLIYHVHFDCTNGASLNCDPASPPGQITCAVCLYSPTNDG